MTPDRWLEDGDQVEVGELTFDVLHCPGHSPGSVAFFNPAERLAIVGDVLFAGSVGRTDLPEAIRDNCSDRSGTSSCPWGTMLRSSADTGRPRRSAANERPILFFNSWPRLPANGTLWRTCAAAALAADIMRGGDPV